MTQTRRHKHHQPRQPRSPHPHPHAHTRCPQLGHLLPQLGRVGGTQRHHSRRRCGRRCRRRRGWRCHSSTRGAAASGARPSGSAESRRARCRRNLRCNVVQRQRRVPGSACPGCSCCCSCYSAAAPSLFLLLLLLLELQACDRCVGCRGLQLRCLDARRQPAGDGLVVPLCGVCVCVCVNACGCVWVL
jgi:hypothetical protein